MGIPEPAGSGSRFSSSGVINLQVADAILSRAQRNSVDACWQLELGLKPNIGAEGARHVAAEAQLRAQRIGNAAYLHLYTSFSEYVTEMHPVAQPVFVIQERSWTAGPLFAARAKDDGCGCCVRS